MTKVIGGRANFDMKIYPNDLCPCGSGKKYKKCCMHKNMLSSDKNKNADFIVNPKGAVVFKDISKQPILEIPEGTIVKKVLSVGISSLDDGRKPMVTIQDRDGAICYILPDWCLGWCETCLAMAIRGIELFPSKVEFIKNEKEHSVNILK